MAVDGRDTRIDIVAVVAVLAILAVGCLVILRPFLAALIWSLILSIATWPAFTWLKERVGGRLTLAATLMTLLLFVSLLLPITIVGATVADFVRNLPEMARALIQQGVPPPPTWLQELPVMGSSLWREWHEISLDYTQLAETVRGYLRPVTEWLLQTGARLGGGVVELALSVVATFFFYRDGEVGVQTLHAIGDKLAGDRARRLIDVAENTIKGVVYGVLGTALAQGTLAAIGLWIAGVPGAFFWGVITCFFSIIPPGAPVVWLPATLWLFHQGETGWGIFMGIWGFFVVSTIDNFLKPFFISRGSALPLLLVVLGVLGGILSFGLLGVFLGPVLLAVGFTLVKEWSMTQRSKILVPDAET